MAQNKLTVESCQTAYKEYSGLAGQTVRQAAYAGIALIWIMKTTESGIPDCLIVAGLFLFSSLAMDMAAYIVPAYTWAIFARFKENQIGSRKSPEEFLAPVWINFPYIIFSFLRYTFAVIGYFHIVSFLFKTYLR